MSYTSVKVSEIKAAKPVILENIKNAPNLTFPCRGVRESGEIPEFVQCGKVEAGMMKLCQPCLQTFEAATSQAAESMPLVAEGDAEQGEQNSAKPSSVVSRLVTWVSNHRVLTALAVLGGVGLVAGATAGVVTGVTARMDAEVDMSFQNSSSNASFGSLVYSPSGNQQVPTPQTHTHRTHTNHGHTAAPNQQNVTASGEESVTTPKQKIVTTPKPPIVTKPKSKQQSAKNFPCSSLGNLQFHVPANANFILKQDNGLLAKFSADENSRIDLNMAGICQAGQATLRGSFAASCEGQNVELLPQDLLSQNALNTKMGSTACKSSLDTSLIFSGELNQGLALDKDKMCDEGMIQGFQFKTNRMASILVELENRLKELSGEVNFDGQFYIYEVKIPFDMCKDVFDKEMTLECATLEDRGYTSFTPKTDLTKGKVKNLNFSACSVTSNDTSLPRKECILAYDAFNKCTSLRHPLLA